MRSSAGWCLLALSILIFSGYGVTLTEAPTATGGIAVNRYTLSRCGAVLNFVGMTLIEARAFAHRCGQSLGSVYKVPNAARAGTVVSESQPFTGNRLVVSTGPLANAWAVLSGAAGPPVAAECTATLQLYQDGNAGPLTCRGEHVNVEAWDYFALSHPPIMRLARGLSVCQVAPFIDLDYISGPIAYSIFELANVYNGWHVPDGLAAHLIIGNPYNDTCLSSGRSGIGKG
ncbi:MAG: hypothetical protein ACRD6W_00255 [Nitrososphaerales archaeon]